MSVISKLLRYFNNVLLIGFFDGSFQDSEKVYILMPDVPCFVGRNPAALNEFPELVACDTTRTFVGYTIEAEWT